MFSTFRLIGPMASTTIRSLTVASQNLQLLHSGRKQFSTNSVLNIREIKISEDDQDQKRGKRSITVEGVVSDLPKATLIAPTYCKANGCLNASENCHPLCRFNFVHEIMHTDILILIQFMDNEGKVISREITGLCKRQHNRMSKLIKMAAKAGLFPENKDMFRTEKAKLPATRFNSYWDDSSIDIQYVEKERKDKIRSFKK